MSFGKGLTLPADKMIDLSKVVAAGEKMKYLNLLTEGKRTLWVKEKMQYLLLFSHTSPPHTHTKIQNTIFVRHGRSKNRLHILCRLYLNPLPDDKILDWSKLKQIADDINF